MIGALWGQLCGQENPESKAVTENELIAYFPQAYNSKSELLSSCFHDVPDVSADLIRDFVSPWPERTLLFRSIQWLDRWKGLAFAKAGRRSTGYSRSSS
jgi:hypothetical protein